MTNSSGAEKLAATVWPISTARLMTVPEIGARIYVRSRSNWACASAASAWVRPAFALVTEAVAISTAAIA